MIPRPGLLFSPTLPAYRLHLLLLAFSVAKKMPLVKKKKAFGESVWELGFDRLWVVTILTGASS